MRWACGSDFSPTGIAPSAVRYGDFVYFKVTDISSEGMQLENRLRNKYLLPGVTIESTCTFPTLGQVRLDLKILHARVAQRGRKSVLSLGVRYTPLDARTTETIGQYLLQFGAGATVQDLCGAGFRITHSARALDFCSVRTPEEYREVLKLRRLAYQHAKKVSQDAKDVDMGDGFDNSSRILVAKHRGRIVGTVRLMFPKTQSDPLKHDEFLPLPPDLPSRDQLVEVSKACTHPSYRGSDLFYTLLKHVALTAIQAGRRYALMSATDSLAPIYLRFGFRQLGASYDHPSMRLRHHLMLLDLKRVVAGRGINPIFWNLMGGYEIWSYARRCGALEEDPWLSARARFLRLFSPLARLVQALYARRLRARESAK
jgi:predicted GNAT family N-acyltransferase